MGTEIQVTVWTADTARAETAASAVFREFDRLDAQAQALSVGHGVTVTRCADGLHGGSECLSETAGRAGEERND